LFYCKTKTRSNIRTGRGWWWGWCNESSFFLCFPMGVNPPADKKKQYTKDSSYFSVKQLQREGNVWVGEINRRGSHKFLANFSCRYRDPYR
jgi:hypothetical protein